MCPNIDLSLGRYDADSETFSINNNLGKDMLGRVINNLAKAQRHKVFFLCAFAPLREIIFTQILKSDFL